MVYSKAASSLADMSQTVKAYGSSGINVSSLNSHSSSSTSYLKTSGVPCATSDASEPQQQRQQQQQAVNAVCGRSGDNKLCWQQVKGQLAALMQEECEGHW
jgi:hypothetical protein